jgi:hypothetical protein
MVFYGGDDPVPGFYPEFGHDVFEMIFDDVFGQK